MQDSSEKFALYFSHSWQPRDVDMNLLVWNEVASYCEMLVDVPEESGSQPPYYINRIEELLRQSDLFLCILAERDTPAGNGDGDAALLCSAYSLFEIRLAERFGIPRLVLYERGSRFKSPRSPKAGEMYVPFDRGASDPLPDRRHWRASVTPKIMEWMRWASKYRKPDNPAPSSLAVSLLSPSRSMSSSVEERLEHVLREVGYESIALRAAYRNNMELFQILRAAGLVVTELDSDDSVVNQINAVAHALCVPAIRTMHEGKALPWLLQGHPGGYQQDIAFWNEPDELLTLVKPRARAMFRISHALNNDESTRYLQSKRYAKEFVFISHSLKPPHRELVERIYELLNNYYVNPFEYHMVNAAGEDWKKKLDEQLLKTTRFVVLLSDGYELSTVCTYELDEILKRGNQVEILPFMVYGRSIPHPKLVELHHRLISGTEPGDVAQEVVERIMETLAGS